MADRFPLILNTSANQIQEIASGDNLDLTGNNISNAGVITATSFSGPIVAGAGTSNITAGIITAVTFKGDGDFVELDVDGHTNLDNVTISGVSTFAGAIDLNSDIDVDGHTNLDNVNIAGVTTGTTINATTFVGDLTGNSTSSDTVDVTSDGSASGTSYPVFVDNHGSGKTVRLDSGLSYVPATNVLTAGTFSGSGASLTGITNANISNSAAIAFSKLATGALPSAITVASANIVDGTIVNADVNASAAIAGTKISPNFGSQAITGTNGTFTGGVLTLGTADTSSSHLNAFEMMTFNIDSDNDDSNRSFKWYKDGNSGSGTQLLALDENGTLTLGGQAILQGGVAVTGNATVSGNLSVGGVLTYEDVTNVDSVGIVTARNGIKVLAGGANVAGVVTATGGVFVPDNNQIQLGNAAGSADLRIYHQSSNNHSYISETGSGSLVVLADDFYVQDTSTNTMISAKEGAEVNLHYNIDKKLETSANGIIVYGPEGGGGLVNIYADEGDDNADKWRLHANPNGSFYIQNYSQGSWHNSISGAGGGSSILYYNNSPVLTTDTLGVTIGDNNGLSINGGTGNRTGTDAVLYVDKTNNNDWCAKFKTNVGSSNDYGLRIECNNNATFPLVVNDGSSNQFRVNGNGNVYANEFHGDGSNLTGVSVGITTEQVTPSSNVATLNLAKDDHKIVASGTYTIDVSGGTEASSHTLRIENSGTANVGFSTFFKFPSGGTPSLPTASGAISLISFQVHKVGSVGIATVLLAGASVNFS